MAIIVGPTIHRSNVMFRFPQFSIMKIALPNLSLGYVTAKEWASREPVTKTLVNKPAMIIGVRCQAISLAAVRSESIWNR